VLVSVGVIGSCTYSAWAAESKEQQLRKALERTLNSPMFGVPESPAFELLPEKASEVVHILTPKDFAAQAQTWFDGDKLKVGVAVDARPFVRTGGSLIQYRSSRFRQIAYRTVLSVGTALASEGSNDALFAAGLRIPIVNSGDPRLDRDLLLHMRRLASTLVSLKRDPPSDWNASLGDWAREDSLDQLTTGGESQSDGILRDYLAKHWNSRSLDIGLAGSGLAKRTVIARDNLLSDRAGVWGALGLPISRSSQLSVGGKFSWARTDSSGQETSRRSLGGRIQSFPTEDFSLSLEGSKIWAQHHGRDGLDDNWTHLAAGAEMYVPELGGWLGVTYGGDIGRVDDQRARIDLRYALYRARIIKRG